MSEHIRTLEGFKNQSDSQLVATAAAVIAGLTGNPFFSNPPAELKALQEALDGLNAALVAQAQGGTAATALKKNKREDVIGLLRKLSHYVQDNCGNNLAVFLTSGFNAVSRNRTRTALANPSILSVDFGNSTQLVIRVGKIARANRLA